MKPVNFDDDFDEDGILKDGRRHRVPMYAMDALQRAIALDGSRLHDGSGNPISNQPGFVTSDAARERKQHARDEYIETISNAWRGAAGEGTTPPVKDEVPTQDARTNAYAQYEQEISERWKGAGR